MKNGTMYATRVARAYAKFRSTVEKPDIPEPDDPIRRLAIAVLGVECGDEQAARAVDRAFDVMVDWNEIRVSSAFELNQATGNAIPSGVKRCQQLIRALQAIYDRENRLSLDRLKGMARREARHFLEQLDGVDDHAVAAIVLWSLGGHAIPVNDTLLAALQKAELVHPNATRAEVQAFLERHISATDAKEFGLIMSSFKGSAVTRKKRTTRKAASGKKS